jgi:UDP-3-O-[3-hydroxymyristoyl] N-acetylglucosamine deacetylase
MDYQQTICKSATLSGVGLHSGDNINLRIEPLKEDNGIIFKRSDISSNNIIPAKFYNVVDTKLCTEIANNFGVKVGTIEHIMAALWGMEIDNALIEVTGPEIPAMDGSSKHFIDLIKSSGIKKQSKKRKALKILSTVSVKDGDKEIVATPSDDFSVDFAIDFEHKSIGQQSCEYTCSQGFEKEIGSARTFGFASEVEYLKKRGFAKGASLENAICLDANGVMNIGGLRCKDEFVKHKVLDCIGDLFLAGYRVVGEFHAKKSGHNLNNKILKKIFQMSGAYKII